MNFVSLFFKVIFRKYIGEKMQLLLIVFLAVHGLVVSSTNAYEDDVRNLLQLLLDHDNTPDATKLEPSAGPLECIKCENIVGSNRGDKYCVSEMPDEVETCAEGVTNCYIRVRNLVDVETRRINTVEVIRGCQPEGVVCDEGIAASCHYERYTQCCDNNMCNVDHVVSFPEN
ncbi:uncharacterized protein LOC121410778 [Lytechinus variegatus]|uniref:uncharacterized protein LOC121410778 n=1 Tax=Lytechinus variegatus TaxID=7654 RepID=UPI001BB1510C|nr:uncharacterized protein LOC121410778 [Lytechinus variegatus]